MKTFSKSLSVFLTVIYFLLTGPLAHATETNFWKERQRNVELAQMAGTSTSLIPSFDSADSVPATSSLSLANQLRHCPAIVSVRELPTPRSSKTIVHIQDVHGNREAQENIGRSVQELLTHKAVGLVALEGAFAPIELSTLRAFRNKTAIRIVADYLLRENRISGPVHAALTSPVDIPPLIGVDDPNYYNENVRAYKDSLFNKTRDELRLKHMTDNLERRIASLPNPDLVDFHSKVKAFREGALSIGDYLTHLTRHVSDIAPDIAAFLEAYEMESSVNFKQVERERMALLSELLKKMNQQETSHLVNRCVAFHKGDLKPAEFYEQLKEVCGKKDVSLSRFKSLNSYVQYVLLTDSIDPARLITAVASMEEKATCSLAKTISERKLMAESTRLHLAGKLLSFSLTPEEWNEYSSFRGDGLMGNLSCFEKFYTEAERRNQAMASNILRAMKESRSETAVLVTGGFHSPGIDRILSQAGVSIISCAPKISSDETKDGSSYLSLFVQEKTPLDKLFAGEKIFLGPFPANGLKNPDQIIKLDQASEENLNTEREIVPAGDLIAHFDPRDHHLVSVALASTIQYLADMKSPKFWRVVLVQLVAIVAPILLLGCSSPRWSGQPPLPFSAPTDWISSTAGFNQAGLSWVQWFNDPQLNKLIESALAKNPLMEVEDARVEQARAIVRGASADRWPTVTGGVEASYPPNREDGFRKALNFFANTVFKIDYAGLEKNRREATRLDQITAEESREAAGQALAADVARGYFGVIGLNKQIILQSERVKNAEEILKDIEAHVQTGLAAENDSTQARKDLAKAKDELVRQKGLREEAIRALEVLVGDYPWGESVITDKYQTTAPRLQVGMPSEVLARHPKILAAWQKVLAATSREKVAQLERLPQVVLTGQGGVWSNTTEGMTDINSAFGRVASGLVISPLFEWGKRLAKVQYENAKEAEALANYAIVVFGVFLECENALSNAHNLEERDMALSSTLNQLEGRLKLTEEAYEKKEVDTPTVVAARQAVNDTRTLLWHVTTERFINDVTIYSATGLPSTPKPSEPKMKEETTPQKSVEYTPAGQDDQAPTTAAPQRNDDSLKMVQASMPWYVWLLILPGMMAVVLGALKRFWIWSTDWLKAQEWTGLSKYTSKPGGVEPEFTTGDSDKTLGTKSGGRNELKYLITIEKALALIHEAVIFEKMIPDEYCHLWKDGKKISFEEAKAIRFIGVDILPYAVRSIYFENLDPKSARFLISYLDREYQKNKRGKVRGRDYPDHNDELIRQLKAGEISREEFDTKYVFHAEVKRRFLQNFRKIRVMLLMKHLVEFGNGWFKWNFLPSSSSISMTKKFKNITSAWKWIYFLSQWRLVPHLWVLYRRTALVQGKIRINADFGTKTAIHEPGESLLTEEGFLNHPKEEEMELSYPNGMVVFEIKWEGKMEEWLSAFIIRNGLDNQGISKYGDAISKRNNWRPDQIEPVMNYDDNFDAVEYADFAGRSRVATDLDAGLEGVDLTLEDEEEEPVSNGELLSVLFPIMFVPMLAQTMRVNRLDPITELILIAVSLTLIVGSSRILRSKVRRLWRGMFSKRFLAGSLLVLGMFVLPHIAEAAQGSAIFGSIGDIFEIDWLDFFREKLPLLRVIDNTILIGMLLSGTFKFTIEGGASYNRKYTVAIAVLPMIISLLVFHVVSSPKAIFLALGVLAVFSVINFRVIQRDTLEMMYIAMGVVAGVIAGNQDFGDLWIGAVAFVLAILFYHGSEFGFQNRTHLAINIKWAGSIKDLNRFQRKVLMPLCEPSVFFTDDTGCQRHIQSRLGTELWEVVFRLRLKNPSDPDEAIHAIEEYKFWKKNKNEQAIEIPRLVKPVLEINYKFAPLGKEVLLELIRFVLRVLPSQTKDKFDDDDNDDDEEVITGKPALDYRLYRPIVRFAPMVLFLLLLVSNIWMSTGLMAKTIPAEVVIKWSQIFSRSGGKVVEVAAIPENHSVKHDTPLVKIRTMPPDQYAAEVKILATALEVELNRLKFDYARMNLDSNRNVISFDQALVTLQKYQIDLEIQQARISSLKENLEQIEKLSKIGTVPPVQISQARAALDECQVQIVGLEKLTSEAQQKYNELAKQNPDLTNLIGRDDTYLSATAALQSQFLAKIEKLKAAYEYWISAPSYDGTVDKFTTQVGVEVPPNTTMADYVSPDTEMLTTFLLPPIKQQPHLGDEVKIYLRDGSSPQPFIGHIISIGPRMARVDNDLQRGMGTPLYPEGLGATRTPTGLEIWIGIPPELRRHLRPGDLVDVVIKRRDSTSNKNQPSTNSPATTNPPSPATNNAPAAPTETNAAPGRVDAGTPATTNAPSVGMIGERDMTVAAVGNFHFDRTNLTEPSALAYSPVRNAVFMGDATSQRITVTNSDGTYMETIDLSGLASDETKKAGNLDLEALTWIDGDRFALVFKAQRELVVVNLPAGQQGPERKDAKIYLLPETMGNVEGIAVNPDHTHLFLGNNKEGEPQVFEVALRSQNQMVEVVKKTDLPVSEVGSIRELSALLPAKWRTDDFLLLILDGKNQRVLQFKPNRGTLNRKNVSLAGLKLTNPSGMTDLPDNDVMIVSESKGQPPASVDFVKLKAASSDSPSTRLYSFGLLSLLVCLNSTSLLWVFILGLGVTTIIKFIFTHLQQSIFPEKRVILVPVFEQNDLKKITLLKWILPRSRYQNVLVGIAGNDPGLRDGVLKRASDFSVVDGMSSVDASGVFDLDDFLEKINRYHAVGGQREFLASLVAELVTKQGGSFSMFTTKLDRIKMSQDLAQRIVTLFSLEILAPMPEQSLRYRLWRTIFQYA